MSKLSHECSAKCYSEIGMKKTIQDSKKCEERCFVPIEKLLGHYKEQVNICQGVFNTKGQICYSEERKYEKGKCEDD